MRLTLLTMCHRIGRFLANSTEAPEWRFESLNRKPPRSLNFSVFWWAIPWSFFRPSHDFLLSLVGRLFYFSVSRLSPSTVYWTVELGSKRWNLVPSSNATGRCALLFLKTIQNERGLRYWFIRVEKFCSWLIFYRKVGAGKHVAGYSKQTWMYKIELGVSVLVT